MKQNIHFIITLSLAMLISKAHSMSAADLSVENILKSDKLLPLSSWNVKDLDYNIHLQAKAYEKGLNTRWNLFGLLPHGRCVAQPTIRGTTFTILNTGYLIATNQQTQKTVIPYGKYDPFHGTFERFLGDGEHGYLHIAGTGSSFISVSFEDYTCVPSPMYQIFRKEIPGKVEHLSYYRNNSLLLRAANWWCRWRHNFDFIKDGMEQVCVARVQGSEEEIPIFHSSILKYMTAKRKPWNAQPLLELPQSHLWIAIKAWCYGFLGLDYPMPDYRNTIDAALASRIPDTVSS